MVAIIGYIGLILLVWLITKNKFTPPVIFIALSVILGLVVGYDLPTINEYVSTGVLSTAANAVLLAFAILFFTIMTEAGLFEPIVDFMMRTLGRSTLGVGVAAVIVACIGHLDGSATTTALVTIPFFLPIFKRMGLDGRHLMLLCGLTMGIVNLMPWCGPMLRASMITGLDATVLWRSLIPAQVCGLLAICGIGVWFGILAKRKSTSQSLTAEAAAAVAETGEKKPLTWKFWFNLALLVAAVITLSKGTFASFIVFMVSCALALIVNFKDTQAQTEAIYKAAKPAFYTVLVLLSAGAFAGVLGQGAPSIIAEMASAFLNILPPALAKHLHLIMGVVSAPLGFVFTSSAYDNSVLPLCIEIGTHYNISAQAMAVCMAIGKNVAIIGSPVYPSTFLILGLAEIDLKDYLKFAALPIMGLCIFMLAITVISGNVPL